MNHASSNIDQQQAQLDQLQQQIKELRSANQGPGFSAGSTNQSTGRKSRWDRTAAPSTPGGQGKGQAPPGVLPLIDLSRPPPGFGLGSMEQERPSAPYYDLPAGLMVPLVCIFCILNIFSKIHL